MPLPESYAQSTRWMLLASSLCCLIGCGKIPWPWSAAPPPAAAVATPAAHPSSVTPHIAKEIDQAQLDAAEAPLLANIEAKQAEIQELVNRTRPVQSSLARLPIPSNALTNAKVSQKALELYRAEIAVYKDSQIDTGPVQEAGWKFLDSYAQFATNSTSGLLEGQLRSAADTAQTAGCKDPLIRLYQANMAAGQPVRQSSTAANTTAYRTLQELEPVIVAPRYAPRLRYGLHYWKWKLSKTVEPAATEQNLTAFITALGDLLESEEGSPESRIFVWTKLTAVLNEFDFPQLQRVYLALIERPGIPPWFIHVIGGFTHQKISWHYRGTGYANTVPERGWEQVERHQQLAARHFVYAWSLQPSNPVPVAAMTDTGLLNDELGTPREWFLRTVALHADHPTVYFSVLNSLRPRWGGSIDEMLELATACLQPARYDTALPMYGLQALIMVQQEELGLTAKVTSNPQLLQVVRDLVDGLEPALEQHPEFRTFPVGQPYFRAAAAALLMQARDLSRARSLLAKSPEWIPGDPFHQIHQRFELSAGLALASTPELNPILLRIDALVQAGAGSQTTADQCSDALRDLETIRQAHGLNDPAITLKRREVGAIDYASDPTVATKQRIQLFVRHTETVLQRMQKFYSDEWLELTTDELLLGWEPIGDRVLPLPPDGVKLYHSKRFQYCQLISMAKFHPPYQVEMRLGTIPGEEVADVPPCGIILGALDLAAIQNLCSTNRTFGILPEYSHVMITCHRPDYYPQEFKAPLPAQPAPHLRLKVWENLAYDFDANNRRVVSKHESEFDPTQGLAFGGGTFFQTQNPRGPIILQGMRIRRLKESRPPASADLETRKEFHRRQIARDPEDAPELFELGKILFSEEKYDEALPLLQSAYKLTQVTVYQGLPYYLATCHRHLKNYEHAIAFYREQLQPQTEHFQVPEQLEEDCRCQLALLLAAAPDPKLRNGEEAVRIVRAYNEQYRFSRWNLLWILAVAQAEVGDFENAKKRIVEARVLAPDDQKEFLSQVEAKILSGKPFHYPAK